MCGLDTVEKFLTITIRFCLTAVAKWEIDKIFEERRNTQNSNWKMNSNGSFYIINPSGFSEEAFASAIILLLEQFHFDKKSFRNRLSPGKNLRWVKALGEGLRREHHVLLDLPIRFVDIKVRTTGTSAFSYGNRSRKVKDHNHKWYCQISNKGSGLDSRLMMDVFFQKQIIKYSKILYSQSANQIDSYTQHIYRVGEHL